VVVVGLIGIMDKQEVLAVEEVAFQTAHIQAVLGTRHLFLQVKVIMAEPVPQIMLLSRRRVVVVEQVQ
jgi:hypothetical protein